MLHENSPVTENIAKLLGPLYTEILPIRFALEHHPEVLGLGALSTGWRPFHFPKAPARLRRGAQRIKFL